MTRDVIDRFKLFVGGVDVERLALNWDQVERYKPPPNFAKMTDTRAKAYIAEFGKSSWELDALDPTTLAGLIEVAVDQFRDPDLWAEVVEEEEEGLRLLKEAADKWGDLVEYLED